MESDYGWVLNGNSTGLTQLLARGDVDLASTALMINGGRLDFMDFTIEVFIAR